MNKLFVFICATLLFVGVAYSAIIIFIAGFSFAIWDVETGMAMLTSLTWQGFRITTIFSSILGAVVTCILCYEE